MLKLYCKHIKNVIYKNKKPKLGLNLNIKVFI